MPLDRAYLKQLPRRFTGEPVTAFGDLNVRGSDRWREIRDQTAADDLWDEQHAELIERQEGE